MLCFKIKKNNMYVQCYIKIKKSTVEHVIGTLYNQSKYQSRQELTF